MNKKIFDMVKFFLGWPLSFFALFFVGKIVYSKYTDIQTSINHINPYPLVLGVFCFIFFFLLRSIVWNTIISKFGFHKPVWKTSYPLAISELRRFIPGNIWSFLSRAVLFSDKTISKKQVLQAMLYESEILVIGCLLVSLFSLSFLSNSFPVISNLQWIIILLSIGGVFFYIYNSIFKKLSFHSLFFPSFKPLVLLKLIFLFSLAFSFYGLGSFLIASSLTFLSPQEVLSLSSFFCLAYLIGYLSLITPMGLGVREAVIVVGLGSAVSPILAAVIAILIRIVFIFSELLFVGLSFLTYKKEYTVVKKLEEYIKSHTYETLTVLAITIYSVYFTTASFLRYVNFFTGRFDLGNMDQTVWNSLHGKLFLFTNPDSTEIISRFAFHADIILVALSPLYLLWNDPRMLLLIQTLVLASGAFFVFLLTQKILNNKTIGFILALCYLLNPSVAYTNLYDFHSVTLATTFLLGCWYFLITKRYTLFFLFAFLAGFTKEQLWLVLSLFGFFFIQEGIIRKNKKNIFLGFVFSLFCISIFYTLVSLIIPHFRQGDNHFALSYFSDFGDSPVSIAKNIVFSPQKIISIIFQSDTLLYIKQLLLPFTYMPLLFPPVLLFALPDFLINILSNNANLQTIYYQYTATITPFLCIATIYSMALLKKVFPRFPIIIIGVLVLFTSLYSTYEFGPFPWSRKASIDMFTKPQSRREEIASFLKTISPYLSVAATNNLGAHLSHREKIYTIPIGMDDADIIAFLLDDPFAQPSPKAQREMVEKLKKNPQYKKLYEIDNFVVFQKTR